MSNLFTGIEDAEIFERGRWLPGGFSGVVVVEKTLAKNTRKAGTAFIAELRVEETNMPEEVSVGSRATWFQKLIDKDVAFPSIKAFAAACLGFKSHEKDRIDTELAPELSSMLDSAVKNPDSTDPEKNAFVGARIGVDTTQVKTQKGMDFTRHEWSPA